MGNKTKWKISESEKDALISALADELYSLRAKAGIPQDELAKIIGVSRQTYGAIERKTKTMSWNTYLSLVFFFDYCVSTRRMLRATPAFPAQMLEKMNGVQIEFGDDAIDSWKDVFEVLDEQAIHTIETVLMVEYARCTNTPGEVVVKSFDGRAFNRDVLGFNSAVQKAIKNIQRNSNK